MSDAPVPPGMFPTMSPAPAPATQPVLQAPSSQPATETQQAAQAAAALFPSMNKPSTEAAKPAPSAEEKRMLDAMFPSMAKPGAPAAAEAKAAAPAAPAPPAPLVVPTGWTQQRLDAFMKEHPAASQAYVSLYAHNEREADAQVAAWEKATREDPEIGGERLQFAIADSHELLREHGSPELKELIEFSGFGSHPAVIRFITKVSRALKQARGRR